MKTHLEDCVRAGGFGVVVSWMLSPITVAVLE